MQSSVSYVGSTSDKGRDVATCNEMCYIIHPLTLKTRARNVEQLKKVFPKAVVIGGSATPSIPVDTTAVEDPFFASLSRPLSSVHLSNFANHLEALKAVAAGDTRCIILEDDVVYSAETIDILSTVFETLPDDSDIVFLGAPSSSTGTNAKPVFQPVEEMLKALPCCDSYIISPQAASRLMQSLLPVKLPFNLAVSWIIKRDGMRAYTCHPNIFADGSKLGAFVSSIEPLNALIWNPGYMSAHLALVSGKVPDKDIVQKTLEAPFAMHPDFCFLRGRLLRAQGDLEGARVEFGRAFTTFKATDAPIGGANSPFLFEFTTLFRELQLKIRPNSAFA